ncbi:MAG TPA: translation elongation factor Ts [Candidatus Krumholzibacteria bacterium]|nr:translation elongation factor Ts [Candidatus Krumholzibacteria bacterium]HPD71115.1 translation elongation factor Ts [Candidatus Krumholzibacteria bacterium]HRY39185.1 translation elongation factor Ts [Candidatus Krumholzibacteria bacterium]
MEITAKMVKELRDATNAGMMDCKKALAECAGDLEKAKEYLRKKGIASAAKKADRATSQGLVGSYIHMGGKVGVLVEVACETDFVARTADFQEMVHNIAMHIAATSPVAIARDEVDPALVAKEKEIYAAQMREEGKPEPMIEKIVAGKIGKFYGEVVLLEQKYVKDPDLTIEDYIKSVIGKLGENMQVKRFARFSIGG